MSEKLCVDSVLELDWFVEVARKSEEYLKTVPEGFLPSWYKENRASLEDHE